MAQHRYPRDWYARDSATVYLDTRNAHNVMVRSAADAYGAAIATVDMSAVVSHRLVNRRGRAQSMTIDGRHVFYTRENRY